MLFWLDVEEARKLFYKIKDKGKIVSAGYWEGGGLREGGGQGAKMTQTLYAHMN
jgi:hypothetical protein